MSEKAPESRTVLLKDSPEGLQSQAIDWLRFPLAVAVVFIHSFGTPSAYSLEAVHADPLSVMSVYNLVRICLSHVLTHIAVPVFFVISGFLFFRNMRQWSAPAYKKKLKSRVRSLMVPYLCWNVLAVLAIVAIKGAAFVVKGKPLSNILVYLQENGWLHLLWDNHVWAEDRTNWLGMYTPMTGPADLPLWFLRDLIVMVFLSPLCYFFLRRLRHYGLLLLALAYVSGIWPVVSGFNITAVFFYCTGAWFGMSGKNLVAECGRVRLLSYVLAVGLLLPLVWFDGRNTPEGNFVYPFYVIAGVCAAFNLSAWVTGSGRGRVRPWLAHSTFFVYALHTLVVLRCCTAAVRLLLPWEHPLVLLLRYLVTPCLTVAVCVGIYLLLKRYTPRLLGVLTGNR